MSDTNAEIENKLKEFVKKINFDVICMHISPISSCILFDIRYYSLIIHNIEVTREFGGSYLIQLPKTINMTNFIERPIVEFEEALEWKMIKFGIEEYLKRSGWPETYFNNEVE
jgi:hypothetical protein